MAEKGIDYRVEYGNFVLFGHDCGFGCRQTNNAPDDRTFQVSVVTCRRAPLHGGIPVDTRGSASRMARLSPLGARFAPCGGAGWKLGFQFYRKKFTPATKISHEIKKSSIDVLNKTLIAGCAQKKPPYRSKEAAWEIMPRVAASSFSFSFRGSFVQ